MIRPPDDEMQRVRELLRLRIDAAAKVVADTLQAAVDLYLAAKQQNVAPDTATSTVETTRVPELMTPQQAADYLGVKASTLGIWRCRRSYEIPFVKVGSKVRYRKTDLDDFLRHRTKDAGQADND